MAELRVPTTCTVRAVARSTTTTRARGSSPARTFPCWDVRWTVDGQRYFRRFDRAGEAEAFAAELRRGSALHWPFDAEARRFVDPAWAVSPTDEPAPPDTPQQPAGETVLSWTQRYWERKWPTIEPRGRKELARYLNRARRHLVDEELSEYDAVEVDAYLRHASLLVGSPPANAAIYDPGYEWLAAHSLPMAAVGHRDLEDLVASYAVNQRDPSRRVSAASTKRMVADLRQCWARAVVDEVIETNPWDRVDRSRWAGPRARRSAAPSLAADVDLVLSPSQVRALAAACGTVESWGASAEAFVLVIGFCGLRPSEACGLLVGDVELPEEGTGWITVRRSRRKVPERYLDGDEDPEWGPLKGRHLTDSRRVPVPAAVVPVLRSLLDARPKAKKNDLLFERRGSAFDLANFNRDVWAPCRGQLFPPDPDLPADSPLQPKLSRLRRHDLRHSACSMWLRAGIDVTVCQKWSGHKQLSVFLDIYQGLVPGREEDGVRRLESSLAAELGA